MTCQQAQDLFSELHEDSLAEGLRFKVRQHLHDCPSCDNEFASFRTLYSKFEAMGPTPVPDDLGEIVARRLDRIDYERKQSSPTVAGRWLRLASVGVAAAALVAVAVLWKPLSQPGISSGVFPPVSSEQGGEVKVEKVDGKVRIRFIAKQDSRVDVLEGGTDYSTLPPVDAKQIRVDTVRANSKYDVPVEVTGPIPPPLWLRVSGIPETIGVFFPQPAVLMSREFEGNTVSVMQAIANGFGVVVEARLRGSGPKRQHRLEGEDPVAAAKAAINGTEQTQVTLMNGVLHVR